MAVRGDAAADGFIRTTNLPSITAFTMMGWFRVTTAPGNATWANALTFGDATGDQFYGLQIAGNQANMEFDLWTGGTGPTGSSLAVGTWVHLALVVDGTGAGNARGYVNGVLDMNGSGNAGITAGAMYIGNDSFNEFWNGRWKAVKVWSAALSVAEIQAEMHTILPRRLANLNGFYPCFPGATERLADYSGNGNNWTAAGTLTDEDDPPLSWGRGPFYVQAAAGGGGISGDLDAAIPALTMDAAGAVDITGALAGALPALTMAASGAVDVAGALAGTVPALTIAASGTVAVDGALGAALPTLTLQSAGAVDIVGAMAAELPALTAALTGSSGATTDGDLVASLPALVFSGAGAVAIAGSLTRSLPALTFAGTGLVAIGGTIARSLPALTMSGAGDVTITGALAAALPALALAASGAIGTLAVPLTGRTHTRALGSAPRTEATGSSPRTASIGTAPRTEEA